MKMNRRIMKGMLIVTVTMVLSVSSISVSAIEAGKKAELFAGNYTGGVDIPTGTYSLKCETDDSTNGIVWLASEKDNLEEDYPSLLYEHVATGENKEFFISLHEGGILHVPFESTLTAVDYMKNDITELHTGTYVCGKDLPEGKYIVSYESDSSSNGIIWLADVGNNLKEDYPSVLYEYVNSEEAFRVTVEEGGKVQLPFHCRFVKTSGGVVFD